MTVVSLEYPRAARVEFLSAAEDMEALTGRGVVFDAETRRVEAAIVHSFSQARILGPPTSDP